MNFGVVRFPGSNCDDDALHVLGTVLAPEGAQSQAIWHKDHDLGGVDVVVLPGGFSYGDYLRAGAIARFSPIMREVLAHAERGAPVLAICNGFQIACEAGLLPGALLRNQELKFSCQVVRLRVESTGSLFTANYQTGQLLRIPIAHGEGRYTADEATLDSLEEAGRVAFRYVDADGLPSAAANPNGSARSIAGVTSERGNVLGMMPHPERAVDPLLGPADGLALFQSALARVGA